MKKSFLIVIDGPMGSGKSTIAQILHKKLKHSAMISLDRLKRIVEGYKLDSQLHLSLASKIGRAMTKEYLKNEINVIIEKAFTKEEYLKEFVKGMNKLARVFIYQLNAPLKLRIRRVKKRPLHPENKKKPPKSKIKRNTKHFEESRYKRAKEFDTSKTSSRKIVNSILKDIK